MMKKVNLISISYQTLTLQIYYKVV